MDSHVSMNSMNNGEGPTCIVTPLPSIGGERRSYRGLAQPFVSHAHEHYVIGCVREGQRTLSLNDCELSIGPGSLIVFNPGDVHGCVQQSDMPFSYDSITIAEWALDGAHLDVPCSVDDELRIAFDEAISAIDSSPAEAATERILSLAVMLEAEEETTYEPRAHEEAAVQTYAHLRGHLADPTPIAELAVAQGISEYTLIRAYRKRFAITPLQHLMAMRVDCACELLAQGLPPSIVAAETGFSDQAHLTRAFKQRIGTTPAAYARMVAQGS